MNKLFNKIAALSVGLAMAIGVGVAIGSHSQGKVRRARAADTTINLNFTSSFYGISTTQGNQTLTGAGATYGFEFKGGSGAKASGSTTSAKSYVLFGKTGAYFRNTSAPTNSYISAISWTYSSGVSTNVVLSISYGSSALSAESSAVNQPKASASGTVSLTPTNQDNAYFFVYVTNNYNCQIKNFSVTWTSKSGGDDPEPVGGSRILTGDSFALTSTYNAAEISKTIGGTSYKLRGDGTNGVKSQAIVTGAVNSFESTEPAILMGKSGAYLYNTTPFSSSIEKLEVYSNKNASTSVIVGVEFGSAMQSSAMSSSTTHKQTLSTADHVYDFSYATMASNYTYFRLQILSNHNAQLQVKITLSDEAVVTPTVTDISISGDMQNKTYNTVQTSWNNAGLTASVTMSDSSSYTGTVAWSYNPESPVAYAISNGGEVSNGTVQATATADEESDSKNITGITVNYATVAQADAATPASGSLNNVIAKGIVSQIDSIDTGTYGNATYYISDDGTTTNQFEVYRGLGLNGAKFTNVNDLAVGDVVVVNGNLKTYSGTKQFDSGSKLLSLVRPDTGDPSITISEASFRMYVTDAAVQLHETHSNEPTGSNIVWETGNNSVATISSTGLVTAVGAGTTTVIAKILDSNEDIVASNSITLTVVRKVVNVGDYIYLSATYESNTYYLSELGGTQSSSTSEDDRVIFSVVAGSTSGKYALKSGNNYLKCTTSSPYLGSDTTLDASTSWEIFNDGINDVIESVDNPSRKVLWNYNEGNHRYGAYTAAHETILYPTITKESPSIDYSAKTFGGIGTLVTSSNESTLIVDGAKIVLTDGLELVGGAYGSYINPTSASVTFSGNTVTVADGTSEVEITVLELESATGGFYLKTKDGKYLGHTSTSTKAGDFKLDDEATVVWVIDSDGIYDKDNSEYAEIRINTGTTPHRFKTYKNTTGDPVVVYSFVEYTDEAGTYAANFLSSGLCGANDNTKASSAIWSQQQTAYLALSNGAQNLLSHAVALESSTDDIQKCLARYDRVIYLHYTAEASAYPDFMNRVANNYVTPKASRMSILNGGGIETSNALAIVLASILGLTTIGGYFVIRKRKFTK